MQLGVLALVSCCVQALRTSITCPLPECLYINAQETVIVEYQALPAPLSNINVSLFRRNQQASGWDTLPVPSVAPMATGYLNLTEHVQTGGSKFKLCFFCAARSPVEEVVLRVDPDSEQALGRVATTQHTDSLLEAVRQLARDARHVDSQFVFRSNRQASQKRALHKSLSRMGLWSGLVGGLAAAAVAAYQVWFVRSLFSGKHALL